jgi:hypothetical protein
MRETLASGGSHPVHVASVVPAFALPCFPDSLQHTPAAILV